jgi:hypothetical protein
MDEGVLEIGNILGSTKLQKGKRNKGRGSVDPVRHIKYAAREGV